MDVACLAVHAMQGNDLAVIDDSVSYRAIEYLAAVLALARGEQLLAVDQCRCGALLEFEQEVGAIRFGRRFGKSKHAAELKIHMPCREGVQLLLRLTVKLERSGEQAKMRRHLAVVRGQ